MGSHKNSRKRKTRKQMYVSRRVQLNTDREYLLLQLLVSTYKEWLDPLSPTIPILEAGKIVKTLWASESYNTTHKLMVRNYIKSNKAKIKQMCDTKVIRLLRNRLQLDVVQSSKFFEEVAQLPLETQEQEEVQHQLVVQEQAEIVENVQEHVKMETDLRMQEQAEIGENVQEHVEMEANLEMQEHLMPVHTEFLYPKKNKTNRLQLDVVLSSKFFEEVAQLPLETQEHEEVQHQLVIQEQAEIVGNVQEHVKMKADVEMQEHLMPLHPKKNVILERYRFNSRIQESDESVDQFVTALRSLAESCEYGTMKDELIRDRIVAGLSDPKTSEELQRQLNLTLEDAMEIAHQRALYQKVEKVIRELTSENFNTSVNCLQVLQIGSVERLKCFVDLIYEKAISEPDDAPLYARMCKELASMNSSKSNNENGQEESMNLKKLILRRCQTECESHFQGVKACTDPMKRKERQLANIGLMGELFKQKVLPEVTMRWCIGKLLTQTDDESLEYLCKLDKIIFGKDL